MRKSCDGIDRNLNDDVRRRRKFIGHKTKTKNDIEKVKDRANGIRKHGTERILQRPIELVGKGVMQRNCISPVH